MSGHYDVGAAVFCALLLAPYARERQPRVRVVHGVWVWLICWLIGLASVFGRVRRPW